VKTLRIFANLGLGWKAKQQEYSVTDLRKAAMAVRENAHAPYSGFKVGAALRGASGEIYRGCNVENVAYPEGTCAEAGAIAAMVAAGETVFTQAYVVAGSPLPVTPCGGCRQKLAEFGAGDVAVTMATVDGVEETMSIQDLLPGAFDPSFLGG
jgi:cytidine deaminase